METKDKLARLLKERDIKRKDIIEATGANKSTVSTWFSGVSKPSGNFLVRLCKWLAIDGEWLRDDFRAWDDQGAIAVREPQAEYIAGMEEWDSSTPLSQEEVSVPFFSEVEAAAGTGNFVQENHGPKLRFAKSTLRNAGVPVEAAACIKVKGNSMEPVLPDGSTVGINTADTNILDGKMYALDHDGMLRIKMVYRLPGGRIRLRSFNIDEHPDESYEKEEPIKIIGRVFWSAALHN